MKFTKTHRQVCRSKSVLCTQTIDSGKKVTTQGSDSEVSRTQLTNCTGHLAHYQKNLPKPQIKIGE